MILFLSLPPPLSEKRGDPSPLCIRYEFSDRSQLADKSFIVKLIIELCRVGQVRNRFARLPDVLLVYSFV